VLREVSKCHRSVAAIHSSSDVPLIVNVPEGVYQRYNSDSTTRKLRLGLPELEDFLRNALAQTIGPEKTAKLQSDTDLFNFGVDSLQSTRLRIITLRGLDLGGKEPSQNGTHTFACYSYPP
jgi:hypothetical protein